MSLIEPNSDDGSEGDSDGLKGALINGEPLVLISTDGRPRGLLFSASSKAASRPGDDVLFRFANLDVGLYGEFSLFRLPLVMSSSPRLVPLPCLDRMGCLSNESCAEAPVLLLAS